ncbi:mitochondrial 37S ribosomal protein uS15m [Calcarisporiella thermophila]|uniref:mitochondrial 37S ribosomal protein uS15m n=1 Tax=Calcarisporiella thermophila TaxID=911321 RepID=UPI003742BBBB
MFTQLLGHCRRLLVPAGSSAPSQWIRSFHTTPIAHASRRAKRLKQANLAKRAARKAAWEASKPSPIISKETAFIRSLSTPTAGKLQHFITPEEEKLVIEMAPQAISSTKVTIASPEEALRREKEKAEMVRRIVSLETANAKAENLYRIQKAIEWFQLKEGDTGSPEVQAAVLTVRILNLHEHLQQHRKDKHNYRALRSMVHQRAKLLRYLKRQSLERYFTCLRELGLDQRAVEGEIVV